MAAFGGRFERAASIEDRKEQTRLARAEVLRQVPPLFRAFFLPFKTSACTENFLHAKPALPENLTLHRSWKAETPGRQQLTYSSRYLDISPGLTGLFPMQYLLNALAGYICSFSLQRDAIGFLPVSKAFTPSVLGISAAWVAQFLCSVLHLTTPSVMSQPESWQRLIWR